VRERKSVGSKNGDRERGVRRVGRLTALFMLLLGARGAAAQTPGAPAAAVAGASAGGPDRGEGVVPAPPGPPPPTRVTWQKALELAAAHNTSTLVADQEIRRAEALVREARAGWLPTLAGNGSYTRIDSARYFGNMVTTPAGSWNGNLALTVPIVAPGAWANDWHAQDARDLARVNAADARRQLATAVGRTYLTVVLQHRQVEVAARARDTAKVHYDYAHTRLGLGLGNGVDEARAAQELHTDEAQLDNAQTALVRAQSALGVLLSADDLVDVDDDVQLAAAPSAEVAIDDARKNRSDVRALQARKLSTEHLRRDDWVYYAPSLLAQAQAFKQTATLLQPGSGWQASVVLSIPFFDGGLRYGIARERTAVDQEARIQLEAALRQVSVEVRTQFRIVESADRSLEAARQASLSAAQAATLADKAYRAGATTNLELIDAERRARDAASQVALAEDNARQARLDLLLATGAFP
jgi:outer membrane protein TolC